jgi:hypothetical protein
MIATFFESEDGAITVDWTVLTGTLVGLGLAVVAVVSSGMEDLSTDISDTADRYLHRCALFQRVPDRRRGLAERRGQQ